MDNFDDDLDEETEIIDESERALSQLEGRIDKLQAPPSAGDKKFAKGIALVVSLGFVLAGCLIAGLMLGEYLVKQTGYPIFQLVGVIVGLAAALLSGTKLMKPLMNSDE